MVASQDVEKAFRTMQHTHRKKPLGRVGHFLVELNLRLPLGPEE